jgi:hypothetical protein
LKPRKPPAAPTSLARGLLALALGLAPVVVGCGAQEDVDWAPSGVGPPIDHKTEALAESTAVPAEAPELSGDLVPMPPQTASGGEVERKQGALATDNKDPRVVYLFYANGKDLPATDADACGGKTPPKFNCTFAPTLSECQRQIQAYLDKWYADLNIVFTLTRPTAGKFYTEVVSSGGGAWCDVSPKVAGVAPFLCRDLYGGVAYTFLGGTSAKQTAIIIAQEQAHLVGLEHTNSKKDLMYPSICSDCDDGFRDEDLPTDGDRCDRATQNSFEMMRDRVGAWPGGPKPSAFGCMSDQVSPTLQIMEPADGAKVKSDFSLRVNAKDDCELATVQVQVMPQSLKATSYAPPYEWDLANISGQQTITVTAIDGAGHITQQTVTVTAPMNDKAAAGCTVASGAFGLAGLLPALGALILFSRRRERVRRRTVSGALSARERA